MRALAHFEVNVGTDIGLGIFQLRGPVLLFGISIEAAGISVVDLCVVLYLVCSTEEGEVGVGLVSCVLEHFLLPIDVGIDIGIAAIQELLHFGIGVGCGGTVVSTGAIERVGIVVGVDHVGRLRVELELVGVAGLEVVLTVLVAMLGLDKQHAVDGFVAVESHSSCILQDGDTFHFLDGEAVDGSFDAIDKDQDIAFACRLHATNIKRCASTFLALEACVLVGVQAKELAV